MASPIETHCSVAVPNDLRTRLLSEVFPTPTYGPSGSWSLACSCTIAAPLDTCVAVVLDVDKYPSWNRFIRKVDIKSSPEGTTTDDAPEVPGPGVLRPGTLMLFDAHMDPRSRDDGKKGVSSPEEVTVLEPFTTAAGSSSSPADERQRGWRVAWRSRIFPDLLLRSERVQEFVAGPDGQTYYYCWQTYYGLLAPVVRWAVGAKLEKAFDAWMEGMQGEAEKRAAASSRIEAAL